MNLKSATIALCVWCIFWVGVYLTYGYEPLQPPEPTRMPTENQQMAQLAKMYGAWEGDKEPLWDKTRCDLFTDSEAIEVDWAPKWAEAIGQSSYYGIVTNKRPAIILLVKDMDKEKQFVYRCQTVCVKLGIKLHIQKVPLPNVVPTLPEPIDPEGKQSYKHLELN